VAWRQPLPQRKQMKNGSGMPAAAAAARLGDIGNQRRNAYEIKAAA